MLALARLCSVVLMLLGLVFVSADLFGASLGRTGPPMHELVGDRILWRWGLGALFAGVIGAALLTIAEALDRRSGPPAPAKSQ
jgi:hypothetical protein